VDEAQELAHPVLDLVLRLLADRVFRVASGDPDGPI